MANGIELDAPCGQQQLDGAVDGVAVEVVAHLQDGRGRISQDFGAELQHGVFAGDLGVRHRHGAAERGGQAQLEVRQAVATQRAAKADHRGLAHRSRLGDLGNRVTEHGARVRQHMLGHPALGR